MNGKCPYCERPVVSLRLKEVDAKASGRAWKAVTLQCPSCNVVLGAQFDPLALADETAIRTVDRLSKG